MTKSYSYKFSKWRRPWTGEVLQWNMCVWWGGSKPHNETWGRQNCVQDYGDGGVTRLRWFSQAGLSLALLTLIIIIFKTLLTRKENILSKYQKYTGAAIKNDTLGNFSLRYRIAKFTYTIWIIFILVPFLSKIKKL
jgi:hypothetical protein